MSSKRLSDQKLRDLLGVLRLTRPDELGCDEWLDQVAAYAEAIAADRVPPPGSDLVAHHLDICPECREEFDALIAILRAAPE